MLSAVFAALFGLSLLPGRKPLCLRFAERISGGILPEGAVAYCRRLTWFWFLFLLALAAAGLAALLPLVVGRGPRTAGACLPALLPLVAVPLAFLVERRVRNRRFRVVFRTSGSTGRSKEIVKTFESLAKEVEMHRAAIAASVRTSAGRRPTLFLGTVQWHHMYGRLWMDLLPKAMGVPADPSVILTPEELIAKMKPAERVFLVTTPSFLDRFTKYADLYDVPRNCVEIVTSGALLTKATSDRTERVFGIAPKQIFGSTETGGVAWRRFPDEAFRVFGPVKADLSDGKIRVRSPFSFRNPYVMGDGVEFTDATRRAFRLLGRLDRLVKINEERVNLAEMEEKVRALGFADCALVKLAGGHGDVLGCVLVAPAPPAAAPSPLELRRAMLPLFPHGTVPKRFRFVAELPRNPQGKVLKGEVERLF